jgi:hypothetical protein
MGEEHVCEKAAIIDEMHSDHKKLVERMHEGDLRFQGMENKLADNGDKLNKLIEVNERINKRLFVDNGTLSVQTKLDRTGRFVAVALWLSGVCTASVIGVAIKSAWSALTGG